MTELVQELGIVAVLRRAWEKVRANGGGAGIDRVTLEEFESKLEDNLWQIVSEVRCGGYRAKPVMRVRPAFLGTSDRALVVPTVRDRVIQRAIADFLYPKIDPVLSPACRAFRKGRSIQGSVEEVGRWIDEGAAWVLRADVRKFFDSIRPDLLLELLEPFVDEAGRRFLGRIVRSRVFDRDHMADMVVGIPQGSPLSPVLANLYLNELDHQMSRKHSRYLRYCDDLIVVEREEDQVKRALETMGELLEPLGLSLNEEKTRVCRAEDGFVFLGFQYGATGRGPALKAVEALRFRLEEILAGGRPDLGALDALWRGWTNYFGIHPECWWDSTAGILALLRARESLPDWPRMRDQVVEARRRLEPPSPEVALYLAEAWRAEGQVEQAWLELASVYGGSSATINEAEDWARVLEVPPTAIRQLVRRLVGPSEGRMVALIEAVAEIGQYEVAQHLSSVGEAALVGEDEQVTVGLDEQADYRLLLDWFQGRDAVHSLEAVSGGHRQFVPVRRPITEEDWRVHLRGDRTMGLPLIRVDGTTLIGVLDVDISKKELELRLASIDELLGRALGAALRLRHELERRGASALLELSGHKGYHLWVRLAEPAPCREIRQWLLRAVQAVGTLPEGIGVEIFPTRDSVKGDEVGPVIKLPLGVHSQTGRRCLFLDDRGEPLGDPF